MGTTTAPRRSVAFALLLTTLATPACDRFFFDRAAKEPVQVGPQYDLGPVPRFDANGAEATAPDEKLVFYRTTEGYCTELRDGRGCAGASGPGGLPTSGDGFSLGGIAGPNETCIETVTANDLVKVVVELPDGATVPLEPLDGSEQAPVNVFSACWEQQLDFDSISATAITADGREVHSFG